MRRSGRGIYRTAFRHRDFTWLMVAFLPARAGDFLTTVALVALIFERTGSAGWVAAAAVATRLPMVLLPPFAGRLADRYDPRRLLVTATLARAVTMTALAVAAFAEAPSALLLALATLTGVFSTPNAPTTAALTPSLVPESDLAAANAVIGGLDALAFVLGPAAGGLLLVLGDPAPAFALTAGVYVAAAMALLRIRRRSGGGDAVAAEPTSGGGALAGFRSLASDPAVLALSVGVTAACTTLGALNVLFVVVSEQRLGTGSAGLGYLLAALGVGGFVGSLVTTRLAGLRRMSLVVTANLLLTGASIGLLAVVSVPVLAALLGAVFGAAYVLLEILSVTLMQRNLPAGRVGAANGALEAMSYGTLLLGALLAPVAIALLGLAGALVALAAPCLVAALGTLVLSGRLDGASAARLAELRPRLALLRQVDALSGASQRALERLAQALEEQEVAAGLDVVREGDPADHWWVVAEGELAVTSTGGSGGPAEHVRVLGPGDGFGEIGLLARSPRTATVSAVGPVRLLRADGDTFLDVVTGSDALARSFGTVATTRLRRTHPARALVD